MLSFEVLASEGQARRGRLTLRLCVGQTNTTKRHVEKAWKRIQEEAGLI